MDVYYQQALKRALNNALSKAQTIANAMALSVDPTPIQINEQTPVPPPIPFQALTETSVATTFSTPIEPGRIEVEAKVEVMFHY